MRPANSRAGLLPLAVTLIVVAACADDRLTTAPRITPTSSPRQALDGNVILVTNASGANVPGSLPWAVSVSGGGSVIQFDSSLAGSTIAVDATLEPFADITVEGPATEGITITANAGAGRIFHLRQGGVLRNVTLSGGSGGSNGPGSAVWTQGPLRLEHTTVSNNNSVPAIHGHDITLVNSTVSGNTASGAASAISLGASGTLVLINSTLANNEGAPTIGWVSGPGSMPTVTLRNSIIASNGSFTSNCGSGLQFAYQGMNISSDATCGTSPALLIANPMLAGLADNGGPTATHGFDPRSPALNGGVSCSVTVDQRYVSRGTSCDIGALEFTDFTVVTLTIDANAATATPNGSATVTGTVKCSRSGDELGVAVDLQQQQKVGKTTTVVRGAGSADVTCTTVAQPWSAVVTPTTGGFVAGSASAAASTNDVPAWVTPSSASRTVKLVRPRR
jgi:hypothetical protein